MGLIGVAFGLGFILGPGIGGSLAEIPVGGHHGVVPCFVAAVLSVGNLVWVLLGVPESLPVENRARVPRRGLSPLNVTAMREAFDLPGVGLAIAVNFIVVLSFTNLDQTFTFFCGDLFGIDERGTGYVLAFIGVMAAGVQGGLVRPLAKRFDESALIRAGVAVQAVAFAGLAFAGTLELSRSSLRLGRPARHRKRPDATVDVRLHLEARAGRPSGRHARHQPVVREPRAHLRSGHGRLAVFDPRRARALRRCVGGDGRGAGAGDGSAQARRPELSRVDRTAQPPEGRLA